MKPPVTVRFDYNGYPATLVVPDRPNGKWIWKTEFFRAFDAAEEAFLQRGYTRVYYQISDRYGSPQAVRLMQDFRNFIVNRFDLNPKAVLFGFSRGGLYAFNYAVRYPENVDKIYLDAPVLDLKDWPPPKSREQEDFFREYGLTERTFQAFCGSPVDRLDLFFRTGIPLMIVAGCKDRTVSFERNAGRLLSYCMKNKIFVRSVLKPEGDHHPHSLEDVTPIVDFVEETSAENPIRMG